MAQNRIQLDRFLACKRCFGEAYKTHLFAGDQRSQEDDDCNGEVAATGIEAACGRVVRRGIQW